MPPVPTCQHIKTNGELCGCPALKDRRFCYFHDQAERRRRANARRNARQTLPRIYTFQLPLLEDANAIQVAIMETIEALLDGRINHRYAGLIFYALQTASANLKHTTFKATGLKPRDVQLDELLEALRAIPDPNAKPDTVVVEPTGLDRRSNELQSSGNNCPGNQTSPQLTSAPSASSALVSPPSDGTMARSHDGTIPHIHAVAEQEHDPVIPSGAATRSSAPQSARSRRSRGTCISAPCNGKFLGTANEHENGTMARFPMARWHDRPMARFPMARSHDGTISQLA